MARVDGHAARYREVVSVFGEEGLSALAVSLGLLGARRMHPDAADATVPERLRHALERLGPTAVKVGQLLSVRPDLLPEDYRIELRRLQDRVNPVPYEQVAAVVAAELGTPPEQAFAYFGREPMASASIGQVHAARLHDGTEVAVKVQRPDIRGQVETDLDILRSQARRVQASGIVPGSLDVQEVADEFADSVRRELDYLAEAGNVARFGAIFAGSSEVRIPSVHAAYTTRRVLTLDRLVGIPFNRPEELRAAGHDRARLARLGVGAYFRQMFSAGIVHADPHPGNLLALRDGRVGFTDFGRVVNVTPGMRDAIADLLLGIVDRDADLAAEAFEEMSFEPGKLDIGRLERELSVMIGKYHGTTLGQLPIGALVEDMFDLVRTHELALPGEFVMLMTILATLEGVGREFDPGFDFIEVARPLARELYQEEFEPEEVGRELLRSGRRLVRVASDLPSSVDRALRRVADGEFSVGVRPERYEAFLARAEELVDRLAFALLIAAFVIGFSTLLSMERLARSIQVLLTVGMVGAVGVALWTFVSIYLARWRSIRRR